MLNEKKANFQLIEHKRIVAKAAYDYGTSSDTTIKSLSALFKVSENTIAKWFCEAISKRYISSDDICIKIMKRHISEYESFHHIYKSCLREMYNSAFEARIKNLQAAPDTLVGVSA